MGRTLDRILRFFFYRGERVGQYGRRFYIWKFRSMVQGADRLGSFSVSGSDSRTTKVGKVIRKLHIDELPNLINVLKGEMTLFGPRPDVPYYAYRIPEPERSIIFSVKPGCIDPATLWNLDEGKKLNGKEDPERYYEEVIWPEKIRKQVSYIERCCGYGSLRKALFLVFSAEK